MTAEDDDLPEFRIVDGLSPKKRHTKERQSREP